MLIEMILDLLSALFLFSATSLLIMIFHKYFRGIKTPRFWIYIAAGFYLMTFYTFLTSTETSIALSMIRAVASMFMFVGVYELYKRFRK